MTLYRASNVALDTTTTFNAGTSITAAADICMQLQMPDNTAIRIVEVGWSQDVATATLTQFKLQTSDTASTLSTALSTTTVKPYLDSHTVVGSGSGLTYATTGAAVHQTGANVTPTSRTVLREVMDLYIPQVYVQQYPLGQWPIAGSAAAENYLQMVVKPTATVNAIFWIVWDES